MGRVDRMRKTFDDLASALSIVNDLFHTIRGTGLEKQCFHSICGASVPCGRTDEGLPVGLQVLGAAFQELVRRG